MNLALPFLAWLLWPSPSFAGEPVFATTRTEILDGLGLPSAPVTVDGQTYTVEGDVVYQVLPSGLKVRTRGMAGVVRETLSPRVAILIQFGPNSDEPTSDSLPLLEQLGQADDDQDHRPVPQVLRRVDQVQVPEEEDQTQCEDDQPKDISSEIVPA